jgi:hypothetical protein
VNPELLIFHITTIVIIALVTAIVYVTQRSNFQSDIKKVISQMEADREYVDTRFDAATDFLVERSQKNKSSERSKEFLSELEGHIKQIFKIFKKHTFITITISLKDIYKRLLVDVQNKGILNYTNEQFDEEVEIISVLVAKTIRDNAGVQFEIIFLEANSLIITTFMEEVRVIIKDKTNSKNERFLLAYLNYIVRVFNLIANIFISEKKTIEEIEKQDIAKLLSEGEVMEALRKMQLEDRFKTHQNTIILLTSRMSRVEEQFRTGTATAETDVEYNKIAKVAIDILMKS